MIYLSHRLLVLIRPYSQSIELKAICSQHLGRILTPTLHSQSRTSVTTRNINIRIPSQVTTRLPLLKLFSTYQARMSSNSTFHPLASSAFSTSGSSGLYDRARPSYPPESLNHIFTAIHKSAETRHAGGSKSVNIVELGAGTGIFTRLLLAPPDGVNTHGIGYNKILAVEPAVGMRKGLNDGMEKIGVKVGEKGVDGEEAVQVVEGTFDNVPVADGWADALIIAQAFHWSHGHYESSLQSFARILRPGAPLILIWNLEDRRSASHPWVPKIRDIYEVHEKGTPQYRLGWWKAIFDLPEFKDNFGEDYDYKEITRVLPTTKQGVIDRVVSKSYITDLDDKQKQEVVDGVTTVLDQESKVWIDQENGVFEYPYATDSYVILRK